MGVCNCASSTQVFCLSYSSPWEKMKYFALLLVVGLAAASGLSGSGIKFEAGKEYVFEYSGRLMTGIPALASQYSGLGINATVSLVKDPNHLWPCCLHPQVCQ